MKILPRTVYFGLQSYSKVRKLFKKKEIIQNPLDQEYAYEHLHESLDYSGCNFYEERVKNHLKECADQYRHSRKPLAIDTIDTIAETAAKAWLDTVGISCDEGCSAVSTVKKHSTFKNLGDIKWYHDTVKEEERAIDEHFQRKRDLEEYLKGFIPYFSQLMRHDEKTRDKLKEVAIFFKRDIEDLDYEEYQGLWNALSLLGSPLHFNKMHNCIFVGSEYQELFDEHKDDSLFKQFLGAEMGHAAVHAVHGIFVSDPVHEFYDLCSQLSVLKDHNDNEGVEKMAAKVNEGAEAYREFHKDMPSFAVDFYRTVIKADKEKSLAKRLHDLLNKRDYNTYRRGQWGHDGAKSMWCELQNILEGCTDPVGVILNEAKKALYDSSFDFEDEARFLQQMKKRIISGRPNKI